MWKYTIDYDELQSLSSKRIKMNGHDVLLIEDKGEVYALKNRCNHFGHGHLLHTGRVRKGVLTCPGHYAQFNIKTGELLSLPNDDDNDITDQGTYEVKVSSGNVYVDIPEAE